MTDDANVQPSEQNETTDIWFDWLRAKRHGGNAGHEAALRASVEGYYQRILAGANLKPGMTMLDIGCGEGDLAFAAIRRIGPSLQVILTDISQPLLDFAHDAAQKNGVLSQCHFHCCGAETLTTIADSSVDVVTVRSVFAYLTDKEKALREIFRVLRPHGRLSMAEPMFRDEAIMNLATKNWCQKNPDHPNTPYLQLLSRYKSAVFPDTQETINSSPLTQWSERDLLQMAMATGFTSSHVELHLDCIRRPAQPWDDYIDCAIHPMAPTLREILATQFSAAERELFERVTRQNLVSGSVDSIDRMVYLTADKPGA